MTNKSNHIMYTPNSAQIRWLETMRPGKRMFWRSGVGTGKTNIMIFTAQRLAHLNPGTSGFIVSHNLVHVYLEIVVPLIQLLKDAGTYAGFNRTLRILYLNNGASIQWAGAHKPESLDGKNVGWGLADEIRYWPEESYNKFVTRIRTPCPYPFEGIFTTPELNWIARRFKDNPDFSEIVAKTSENAENLQPSFYTKLKQSLSPELYESYVNGAWMSVGGGVFPEFKEELHVEPSLYDSYYPVHVAFDPAAVKSAAIFFQHYEYCRKHEAAHCIHVLDELMLTDVPTIWGEQQWKAKFAKHGWRKGICYIDSAGNTRSTSTHVTDVSVLQDAGWVVVYTTDPLKRSIRPGIQAIRGKLKPFQGNVSLFFHERLLHDPSQRGIILAIKESTNNKPTGSPKDNEPSKDGTYDHARDTLRYAIVNLCPMPTVSSIQSVYSAGGY